MKPFHLKSKLIGHVHDSIVLYIHKSEVEQMYHILKDCMEVFDYSIPILAEIELGSIWGFGEEVTEKNIDQF
jgi:DNA polymerase I-like protein with 3'-5' exonuclease and polymerase domains